VISRTVARRYAKAVFELAEEAGDYERTGKQLHFMLELISSHRELESIYENPAISPNSKLAIFEELEPELELDKLSANFIRLLIRKGRIHYLEAIVAEYDELERERRGIVVADVKTARPLTDTRLEELRSRLADATGKEIDLQTSEDTEILGGFVARIGGTVYDGSVEHQLQKLRKHLVEE